MTAAQSIPSLLSAPVMPTSTLTSSLLATAAPVSAGVVSSQPGKSCFMGFMKFNKIDRMLLNLVLLKLCIYAVLLFSCIFLFNASINIYIYNILDLSRTFRL